MPGDCCFMFIVLMFISTEKKSTCHVIKRPSMKHEQIPLQLLQYVNLEKYITQARRKRDSWGTVQPLLPPPPPSKIYAKLYFSRIEKSIEVIFT